MVLHHICAGERSVRVGERGEFRVDGSGYGDNGFFQKEKEMLKKKKKPALLNDIQLKSLSLNINRCIMSTNPPME